MSSLYSLRKLTGFLFLGTVVLGSLVAPRAPLAILAIGICLLSVGFPLAIYAFRAMERYKDVFDYEPAIFRGRASNGKQARETLMALSTTGMWCGFSGIALLLIVFFNLRVILLAP